MAENRTPQDKKRKSLERDGRNCYGENDKSSRKAIRRRKAIVNRSFRRTAKRVLSDSATELVALNEHVDGVKRKTWTKVPDKPLGDHLLDKMILQIITRASAVSNPKVLLDNLESRLIETGTPRQAARDVMRQLQGLIRGRWSTSFPMGLRSKPLRIDYNIVATIMKFLDRAEASRRKQTL